MIPTTLLCKYLCLDLKRRPQYLPQTPHCRLRTYGISRSASICQHSYNIGLSLKGTRSKSAKPSPFWTFTLITGNTDVRNVKLKVTQFVVLHFWWCNETFLCYRCAQSEKCASTGCYHCRLSWVRHARYCVLWWR